MIDDLAVRRKLEIAIDNVLLSKDPEVLKHAVRAKDLLKEKKLEAAVAEVTKAEELARPLKLIDYLVTPEGGLKSRAEARRLIESSGVRVDGVVAKSADLNVRHATRIEVGKRVARGT